MPHTLQQHSLVLRLDAIAELVAAVHTCLGRLHDARCPTTRCVYRQVCRAHPEQKGKYIKIILALLQSRSTAVM